ncbi:hypothetical protein GCM10029992_22640 [Glycomyces albus]
MTETGQTDCGCPDWRTDADLDTDFASDASNVFPTGLFPEEHAPKLKAELDRAAEQAEADRAWAAARAARAKARARFTTEAATATDRSTGARRPAPAPEPKTTSDREPASAANDPGPPPFLTRPSREPPAAGGSAPPSSATRTHAKGFGPSPCPPPRLTDH